MMTALRALGIGLLAAGLYFGWLAWCLTDPEPALDNAFALRMAVVVSATAAVLVLSAVMVLLGSIRR